MQIKKKVGTLNGKSPPKSNLQLWDQAKTFAMIQSISSIDPTCNQNPSSHHTNLSNYQSGDQIVPAITLCQIVNKINYETFWKCLKDFSPNFLWILSMVLLFGVC